MCPQNWTKKDHKQNFQFSLFVCIEKKLEENFFTTIIVCDQQHNFHMEQKKTVLFGAILFFV